MSVVLHALQHAAFQPGADPGLDGAAGGRHIQNIFRGMQAHGLFVADNGSDLYIIGTMDSRWSNDQLNPAFRRLLANGFDVVRLGWR